MPIAVVRGSRRLDRHRRGCGRRVGVMDIVQGAGAAEGDDGPQAGGEGRDDGVMGIVRLSRKPGWEAA